MSPSWLCTSSSWVTRSRAEASSKYYRLENGLRKVISNFNVGKEGRGGGKGRRRQCEEEEQTGSGEEGLNV